MKLKELIKNLWEKKKEILQRRNITVNYMLNFMLMYFNYIFWSMILLEIILLIFVFTKEKLLIVIVLLVFYLCKLMIENIKNVNKLDEIIKKALFLILVCLVCSLINLCLMYLDIYFMTLLRLYEVILKLKIGLDFIIDNSIVYVLFNLVLGSIIVFIMILWNIFIGDLIDLDKEHEFAMDEDKQCEIIWAYRNVYVYTFGSASETYCHLFLIFIAIDACWKKIVIMPYLTLLLFFCLIFVIIFRVQFYYVSYKIIKK